MAEPENLVLELLREMRSDVRDVREELREGLRGVRDDIRGLRVVQDNHSLRFDFLEERVEALREATMTALGFAVDASERKKTERVERLEKAK